MHLLECDCYVLPPLDFWVEGGDRYSEYILLVGGTRRAAGLEHWNAEIKLVENWGGIMEFMNPNESTYIRIGMPPGVLVGEYQ